MVIIWTKYFDYFKCYVTITLACKKLIYIVDISEIDRMAQLHSNEVQTWLNWEMMFHVDVCITASQCQTYCNNKYHAQLK